MRSTLVYDLPTRLFHWLFAGLFVLSFTIAKTVDDETIQFSYHMLSGFVLAILVLWRIMWGVIGSRYAKFAGFDLNIFNLKNYFLGILSGSNKRWPGHNPASSWAAIIMFSLVLGLVVSGYFMTTGYKESIEEIHEFMANAFVILVIAHVTGIIFHSLRHKDRIALSMLDGKKDTSNVAVTPINSERLFAAILLLALIISAVYYLASHFNSENRTLSMFGKTLQLGENEHESDIEDILQNQNTDDVHNNKKHYKEDQD